jgi:hypothetical protein
MGSVLVLTLPKWLILVKILNGNSKNAYLVGLNKKKAKPGKQSALNNNRIS